MRREILFLSFSPSVKWSFIRCHLTSLLSLLGKPIVVVGHLIQPISCSFQSIAVIKKVFRQTLRQQKNKPSAQTEDVKYHITEHLLLCFYRCGPENPLSAHSPVQHRAENSIIRFQRGHMKLMGAEPECVCWLSFNRNNSTMEHCSSRRPQGPFLSG